MKNFLIISDLSHLQPIKDSSVVVGGVYADTFTLTSTNPEFATADAGAVAIGETTYTNTQTKTTVTKRGIFDYLRADATAIAFAMTGNKIAISWMSSTSISLYLTNPE